MNANATKENDDDEEVSRNSKRNEKLKRRKKVNKYASAGMKHDQVQINELKHFSIDRVVDMCVCDVCVCVQCEPNVLRTDITHSFPIVIIHNKL